MASIVLPYEFPGDAVNPGDVFKQSRFYQELAPAVKEIAEKHPFLLDYFGLLPIEKIGMPVYYAELSRKLSNEKNPNFIYPTQREGVFVHVLNCRWSPPFLRITHILYAL